MPWIRVHCPQSRTPRSRPPATLTCARYPGREHPTRSSSFLANTPSSTRAKRGTAKTRPRRRQETSRFHGSIGKNAEHRRHLLVSARPRPPTRPGRHQRQPPLVGCQRCPHQDAAPGVRVSDGSAYERRATTMPRPPRGGPLRHRQAACTSAGHTCVLPARLKNASAHPRTGARTTCVKTSLEPSAGTVDSRSRVAAL